MSRFEFSYAVIRYRREAASGEALNVGVVAFAPETGEVGVQFCRRYSRLSDAFAGFDGEMHRTAMNRMKAALHAIARPMAEGLFQLEERERFSDAEALLRAVWPDQGLAYWGGPALYGVTEDLGAELTRLYDRFVGSQGNSPEQQARRDEEAVWDDFARALTARGVRRDVWTPKAFGPAQVEFEHAYKNGKWHVVEPVSLDYLNPGQIKERAILTFGKVAAVSREDELGSVTVLVGKPQRIETEQRYHEAMRLLTDLQSGIARIVEEDHLGHFAGQVEADLRAHGLLEE